MTFIMIVLLGNVIHFTACNVERLDEELTSQAVLERQNDGCRLVISGNVASTEDLSAIEGVQLDSDIFDEPVTANEDGTFVVDINFDSESNEEEIEIEVSAEGFLTQTIEVNLAEVLEDCTFLTEVEWTVGLSPKKPAIQLSATGSTTTTIEDQYAVVTYGEDETGVLVAEDTVITTRTYTITFPSVSGSSDLSVCVSPDNGFARGNGITIDEDDTSLPLIDFVVDAPEGLVLNGNIELTFSTPLPLGNGAIINVSNGAITGFDRATGTFTIIITSLDDIEVVNSLGCVIESITTGFGQEGDRQSLSNCNCGDAQEFNYVNPFSPSARLSIDFPAELSALETNSIIENLNNCLSINGITNDEIGDSEEIRVVVDKCEVVTLEANDIVTTYRGQILGIPFTYRVTAESQVTLTTSNCPTTTACHQGCPE
ncbi:MAG: hypothetical protein AAGK47_04630 [Bacteroidota bacterium]